MKTPPALQLESVSIRRPDDDELLIEQADWTVESGDWWMVAGAHGSGKSAFLQSLAGLVPLGGGGISVFGERFASGGQTPRGWSPIVGLVFEGGGRLLRELTVAENISLPVGYHRHCTPTAALEEVLPLIQTLDLERFADIPAGRIGRAWSQRVALARALSMRPRILLLDNPLVGLDRTHTVWWREFLSGLRAGHPIIGPHPLTLIMTTDLFCSWMGGGQRFAVVQQRRFQILGEGNGWSSGASDFGDGLQPE